MGSKIIYVIMAMAMLNLSLLIFSCAAWDVETGQCAGSLVSSEYDSNSTVWGLINNPVEANAGNFWNKLFGSGWGLLAVLLDAVKGAIPVGLANFVFDVEGVTLVAVALAPIAGHAFSPFLGFRGGKALAVTFGIWTGLTLWIVPTILGIFFGIYLTLIKSAGWAVIMGIFSLLVVLLFIGNPLWLGVWAGMFVILAWKHRGDLAQKPELRRRGQP